jgi:hypothetical protein
MKEAIFGAKPGEPVPEVDPQDMKAVWTLARNTKARFPGENVGVAGWERSLKPGADAEAVRHRISLLGMVVRHANELELQEVLAPFLNDGEPSDAMFRAMAEVPMEGVQEGEIYHGFPFDFSEFLVRLNGGTTPER